MYTKLSVILFAVIAVASCNDLSEGPKIGKIIFDEKYEASPAIWVQTQKVIVNAGNYEVISRIEITDQRENKDGEARIVEGGPGHNNVSIELKSPTIFRGFDFHVVVSSVSTIAHPGLENDVWKYFTQAPKQENATSSTTSVELTSTTETPSTVEETEDAVNAEGDQSRLNRDTETQAEDKITPTTEAPNQEEKTTELYSNEPDQTTEVPDNKTTVTGDLVPITKDIVKGSTESTKEDVVPVKLDVAPEDTGKYIPIITSRDSKDNTGEKHTTTIKPDDDSVTTEATVTTTQNFDHISKELGKPVLFGINNY